MAPPRLTKEQLAIDVTDRGYMLLHFPPNYKSVRDKSRFKCLTCNEEWETSVHSYRTTKSGCPLCKKETVSRTHKGKNVSEKTRFLIGKKVSARPGSLRGVTGKDHPAWKGRYGRNKSQQSTEDYEWKNAVKKRCQSQCIITGEKNIWNVITLMAGILFQIDVMMSQMVVFLRNVFIKCFMMPTVMATTQKINLRLFFSIALD
jgi:hypothetical protein